MVDLGENKIIAAVRSDDDFDFALKSRVSIIFLLSSNIMTVNEKISAAHKNGKKVFLHLDMSEGIGRDAAGVEYLEKLGVDGVISTRTAIIRAAHDKNLTCVQRIFAIDYQATKTSALSADTHHPTYIEILPGVIPKVISHFCESTNIPIIAGGLIETKDEIDAALKAGAIAVSTSNKDLW